MSWLPVIGGVVDAVGSITSGISANNAAKYNAQISEQQAGAERESAKLTEYQKRKEIKQVIGSQQFAYARSGVNPMTGSPLTVMLDSLSNAELDIAIGNYNSETQARRYESEAEMSRWKGRQAVYSGYSQAGSTLLKTAGDYYTKYKIKD